MSAEFDLIRRFFTRRPRKALLGVGDDCALLGERPGMELAVSTDMLVEGRHFHPGTDPAQLGVKSLAVNLSDLAAMGAEPAWAVLALALPSNDEAWLQSFAGGFFAMAERFALDVVGGDTTRGPLCICVTVGGHVPAAEALRRDRAQAGDDVWLSGETGDAALALAHGEGRVTLAPEALAHCRRRLDSPEPRVALGMALRGIARAAIDVSDGLLADLGHVAQASGADIVLDAEALPRSPALRACPDAVLALQCVAGGGDDYELAFTAPPGRRGEIAALSERLGLALTRIGSVQAGSGRVRLLDAHGRPVTVGRAGYDHFEEP